MRALMMTLLIGACGIDQAPAPDAGPAPAELWTCSWDRLCADGAYASGSLTLPNPLDSELAAEHSMIARCESVPCIGADGHSILSRCHASCSLAIE